MIKYVDREVIKYVDREVEVPKEVIKYVEKIVTKEVPVEVIKYVDREVIKQVDRDIVKEVPVEVIKFLDREVMVEVPVEVPVPFERIGRCTSIGRGGGADRGRGAGGGHQGGHQGDTRGRRGDEPRAAGPTAGARHPREARPPPEPAAVFGQPVRIAGGYKVWDRNNRGHNEELYRGNLETSSGSRYSNANGRRLPPLASER